LEKKYILLMKEIIMDDANLYDEIAAVARELYEKSGRVEGHDLDNWLEAEKIVKTRYAAKIKNEDKVIKSSIVEHLGDERRRHKRFIVKGRQRNVTYSPDTKIINIGVGGVAIETTKNLEINKEYSLKIYYKGKSLRLKCRAIWAVLLHSESKESGDIIPIYKAGMKFL
jgi:hypothetical protein